MNRDYDREFTGITGQPEVWFREIRQRDPLYRARYWQAWAITTAVWLGALWFAATEVAIPLLKWMGNR